MILLFALIVFTVALVRFVKRKYEHKWGATSVLSGAELETLHSIDSLKRQARLVNAPSTFAKYAKLMRRVESLAAELQQLKSEREALHYAKPLLVRLALRFLPEIVCSVVLLLVVGSDSAVLDVCAMLGDERRSRCFGSLLGANWLLPRLALAILAWPLDTDSAHTPPGSVGIGFALLLAHLLVYRFVRL
jgi:hypothetical protein